MAQVSTRASISTGFGRVTRTTPVAAPSAALLPVAQNDGETGRTVGAACRQAAAWRDQTGGPKQPTGWFCDSLLAPIRLGAAWVANLRLQRATTSASP